ncbi:hypothetical protein F5Y18DRAFT_52319 [Xylariaceae sp. FL1019]|nr:hypothetical protein F5Y18DRAFT_52319 [Xylariaceae sp. FL1019]
MMDKPPGLTRGTTIRQGKLVALNLLFVKNLSHPDLTLAERCHLHFAVSKTIIHELCHALFQQRFLQRNMNGAKEPFYDFKEVAEMGEVLEFGMFGGRCEVKPFSRTLPIAANIHTWPGVDESTSAGKISSRLDKPRDAFVIHVHAAWLSKLLSRDFWNDASIPRKSDNFFHRTNVVRMDTITRREWPYRANIELRDVTVETDQSRWSNVEVDVMNAWNQRHHEWTLERNLWFNEERTRWDNSPWGIPNWINYAMADFAKAFAEKDYHQCRRCIQLVGLNRTGGIRWLDTPFTAALPPTSAHGDIWYFFAIGLLMTAALPIRQLSDPPPPVPQTPRVLHRYVPSRESLRVATERGLDLEDPIILSLPQRSKGVPTTPPYYNPFGKNPTEAIPPTQLGHLQVLDSILQHIRQQGAVVSGPWFRKIAEASASIQNERIQLNIRHPSNHLSQAIAKWDFTPPGYDPQNMGWVRWSLDRKQFEEVPGYQPPQPTTSAHGLA